MTDTTRVAGTLLLLLAGAPVALPAQQMLVPAPQTGCAMSDSLLHGAPRTTLGRAVVGGTPGARWISAAELSDLLSTDHGIKGVEFMIHGDSGLAIDSALIQVNTHVFEGKPRPVDKRQGALIVDDSIRLDMGSMTEDAGLVFPTGARVWNVYGIVPRGQFLRLARAKKIRLEISDLHTDISTAIRDDLRAALAAYSCRSFSDRQIQAPPARR